MDFHNGFSGVFHKYSLSFFLRSLRTRLFLLVFLTGVAACLVVHFVILENYEARAISLRTSEVQTQTRILADHLITYGYLQDTSNEIVNAELTLLANLYDGRVMIINDNLNIIRDTYGISEKRTIISEEVVKCLRKGNDGTTSVYDANNGYIEITTPIIKNASSGGDDSGENKVQGVILISVSTEYISTTLSILGSKARTIELIIIIVLFAFSIIMASVLLRPFDRITSAINELKAGYSDEEISVPDYIETQHIVTAFNQLRARMKALDDSRQEFVSNVSHELKTPITSMKVLADTLMAQPDSPIEMYQDFMQDISSEVDREAQIIDDLLALVKMDKTATELKLSNVDINEMTENILRRLRPIARKNNIELTFDSRRSVTAQIDEVKLSLAIMNLVENAIKYNRDQGWVKVILDADHQNFILTISDSGIGIPEDSIELIFNRFYRVDKSRSREIGGTGLGLSITRSVILMHRGTIDVASTLGEGTTFTVKVPLSYVKG
ncbi:sensor histidine kinase [Butyrivibrio sp. MC2013]|uniref:sensor histidine kinase n=1 Tax=Butyrivibrio sp. MC2013 TaxID=1280686 RepID=UPI00041E94C0|nr:HAMP domain-containing sensor histidine kinase [Butyrivibrio sp. MC2013]